MHTLHTPPSHHHPSSIKNIWNWLKKNVPTMVHNLTYNPKKQQERNRKYTQFILKKYNLLDSIEKSGVISEQQKSFFDENRYTLDPEVQNTLKQFLKKKYLTVYGEYTQKYQNGSLEMEKIPEEDFQLLVWGSEYIEDFSKEIDPTFLVYFAQNYGKLCVRPMRQIHQQYWDTCMKNLCSQESDPKHHHS